MSYVLALHVPPTCSPTALRSPGLRLCVRAASVRPSERLVVGRVVRCQLLRAALTCTVKVSWRAARTAPVSCADCCESFHRAGGPPEVDPECRARTALHARTGHRHRGVSSVSYQIKWKRFFRSLLKYQWEIGKTGSQHASRAWRIRAGAYPA
jgi:hypothetical protein